MSTPRPDGAALAVAVCAASNVHTSGRGRHDAEKYGPCSDHARIVAEVLAQPFNTAHVAAYAAAAVRAQALVASLNEIVQPGWHRNTGYQHDDVLTAYAAGRNDLLDTIRGLLADVPPSAPDTDTPRDTPPEADQNWWDDRTMPNDDGPEWHRDADGVLWQVDPRSGHRHRVNEAKRAEPGAESNQTIAAHLGGTTGHEPDHQTES